MTGVQCSRRPIYQIAFHPRRLTISYICTYREDRFHIGLLIDHIRRLERVGIPLAKIARIGRMRSKASSLRGTLDSTVVYGSNAITCPPLVYVILCSDL